MKTCKNCVWWKRNKRGEYKIRKKDSNFGQCLELDPTKKHDFQSVWIDAPKNKRFETYIDFGCIYFKKKEKENAPQIQPSLPEVSGGQATTDPRQPGNQLPPSELL